MSEVEKLPSPPFLVHFIFVTLVVTASDVVITLPWQIVWAAPALTIGLSWIGILTFSKTIPLQGAFGVAVTVNSINLLALSVALGVTKGVNEVSFEIVVPVVEVHLIEAAFWTTDPLTNTFVSSSHIGAWGVTTVIIGDLTILTSMLVTNGLAHGSIG